MPHNSRRLGPYQIPPFRKPLLREPRGFLGTPGLVRSWTWKKLEPAGNIPAARSGAGDGAAVFPYQALPWTQTLRLQVCKQYLLWGLQYIIIPYIGLVRSAFPQKGSSYPCPKGPKYHNTGYFRFPYGFG